MKRSLASVALAATLGLTLSACGGTAESAPAAVSSAPSEKTAPTVTPVTTAPTPTPADTAKKSSRGNLIKKLGQRAGFSNESGVDWVSFTINSIEPVTCTEPYASAPVNGHLLAVDMSIVSTPEFASANYPVFAVSPYDFRYIDPATGTTFNGSLATVATYSCLPSAAILPSAGIGPDQKVTGKVILDLPATSGTLVLSQMGGPGGWEYTF